MGLPHTLEKVVFKMWRGADENGEAAGTVARETMKWFRRMKVLEEIYQRSLHVNVEDGVEDAGVVEEDVDDVDENQVSLPYFLLTHSELDEN